MIEATKVGDGLLASTNDWVMPQFERAFIVDTLKDILVEIEELDEVSQRVEDKVISSLEILGESYE